MGCPPFETAYRSTPSANGHPHVELHRSSPADVTVGSDGAASDGQIAADPRFVWLIGEASTVRELAASMTVGRREDGQVSDYRLSEDPTDLDMDRVVRWISTDAYWAKGRTREVIERSFANSFPVGCYTPGGTQAAVARIVSDRATFAWLCDVYVDRDHRGRGLGTMLADWTVTWAERHEVKRIMLATLDAHGVYAEAGFAPVRHPERWMEIDRRPPLG